jgi:hypothetical protein
MTARRWISIVVVVSLLTPAPVSAETCATGSPLDGYDSEERYAFIDGALDADARRMRRWKITWVSLFSTAAVGELGAAFFVDEQNRIDRYIGGTKAALGVVSFLFPGATRVTVLDDDPGPHDCADVVRAEAALTASANSERMGFLKHAPGIALNATTFLILWLGYDRLPSAVISTAIGLTVGEIFLWTQPTGAVEAQARYRAGDIRALRTEAISWSLSPTAAPDMLGLHVSAEF